jgi:ankyrin repeat protein
LLLDAGADFEVKDKDGQTPLLYASTNGHEAVVKLLLTAGAGVVVKDKDDWPPLLHTVIKGHAIVVKLLLDTGNYMFQAICILRALTQNGDSRDVPSYGSFLVSIIPTHRC